MMKTYIVKKGQVAQKWYLFDAAGKNLGRSASRIASILRGKNKPEFSVDADVGDFVVVINADKIAVTGNKFKDKKYFNHSGFPGGMKETNFEKLQARHPGKCLEIAVKGMLPKNPLGRSMFSKLKVYAGTEHPHTAQQPELLQELA